MKQNRIIFIFLILFSFLTIDSIRAEAPFIPKEITEDLFYEKGVVFEPVEKISNPESLKQVSVFQLNGTGSVTVGSSINDGYPRILLPSRTTIKSTREWRAQQTQSPWFGQFDVVRLSGVSIDPIEGKAVKVLDAYKWGIGNESFNFSQITKLAFKVTGVRRGTPVYLAHKIRENWKIDNDNICLPVNDVCVFPAKSLSSVAIITKKHVTCPDIANGNGGTAPECIITCDEHYAYNVSTGKCAAFVDQPSSTHEQQNTIKSGSQVVTYDRNQKRTVYIKPESQGVYRGSTSPIIFENPNTSANDSDDFKESINRELQRISEVQQNLKYDLINRTDTPANNQSLETHDEPLHSAAVGRRRGRLSSTGPEVFIIMVVIGSILMVFGLKRNA